MQLVVLGISYKTVPVEIRECYAVTTPDITAKLMALDDYSGIDEAVVLSTCNRTEVYAVVDDDKKNKQALRDFFLSLTGITVDNPDYFYCYTGKECISHLFSVAASLDSLVIGEGQILGQVKQAYAIAHECDATGVELNMLFQQAIATGKRIRTETHIAYNAVSVSYAAVQLAEKIFGSVKQKNILLFGAGQMAELAARNFRGKGADHIYIVNRHLEHAEDLAQKVGGQAVPSHSVQTVADQIDIIITSTGAPHYIMYPQRLQQIMEIRHHAPLVLIDIAVPRDVDPAVGDMQGITLYNIDNLETVVQRNTATREQEAQQAARIIAEDTDALLDRFRYLSVRPVMMSLAQKTECIRRHALKRAMTKLPDLSKHDRRIIEDMSRVIVRKILRDPMTNAAKAAETPDEESTMTAMSDLFNLTLVKETNTDETKTDHRNKKE